MLLVVAALMGDGRLDALIGVLGPKSRIASIPATSGEQRKCVTNASYSGNPQIFRRDRAFAKIKSRKFLPTTFVVLRKF